MFITCNGKRTSRKVGDKKAAAAVAGTIRAKLQLGEFGFEDPKPVPTFGEYSKRWLRFVESQCKGKESKYKLSTSKVSKRLFSKNGHKKKPIEKTEIFTPDKLNFLLEVCKDNYKEYYLYFLMASRTGMRLGELLALDG